MEIFVGRLGQTRSILWGRMGQFWTPSRRFTRMFGSSRFFILVAGVMAGVVGAWAVSLFSGVLFLPILGY